jgi:NAD+ synthase (glutamine-hydrolysing)
MRVALCQLNSTVGDLNHNLSRMRTWYDEAVSQNAELVIFPELALTGYPPRDLLELKDFNSQVAAAIETLAGSTGRAGLVFGTPLPNPLPEGKPLRNGCVVAGTGKVLARIGKKLLPTYDVFDESRHFEADPDPAQPVEFGGIRWGFHICEDAWNEKGFWPRRLYPRDPVSELAQAGAEVLVNLSASPFHARKIALRRSMFKSHALRHRLPLLYANAVGGNDELVFDGECYIFDATGQLLASGEPFVEDMVFVEVQPGAPGSVTPLFSRRFGEDANRRAAVRPELHEIEAIHDALVLGLRDYVRKCGFRAALLGLSGGIDSAVCAVLAADALGAENVWGISLPSRYSSPGSLEDAEQLARTLGIRYDTLSIEPVFGASLDTLAPVFASTPPGLAEENLQARARALLLMGLSNKFGHLLLTTGNKSEIALGYCTLYGDMAGGLAPISDLPKTTVYDLARYMNRARPMIPESTLSKPPSAELRPGQRDEDSLPPYALLDRILEGFIEGGLSTRELVDEGLPESVVRNVLSRVAASEYKRRQAAPGLKISPKAFGLGRRMPIAARWP